MAKANMSPARNQMPTQDAAVRAHNFDEVALGYSEEIAIDEANRCLNCKNKPCVAGCPVNINIPGFIKQLEIGNIHTAAAIIQESSTLPAVCGRVCPQEKQCEAQCIHVKMGHEPVAIGYLERFVADWHNTFCTEEPTRPQSNGHRVAIVGELDEATLGTIKVKLYDETPLHRDNFVKLAQEKYYDGMRFHRVIEGFMIQGGDPYSRDTAMINRWGTGGPDYTIPAEFVGEYHHKKGAIAAARKGDMANPKKASSGSQFYIVQDERTCAQLDGAYTVFGETLDGFEVIDKIASVQTDQRDRPVKDIKIITIKPVI